MPKKKDEPDKQAKLAHHEELHKELNADRQQRNDLHYGFTTGDQATKTMELISTGSLLFDYELEGGFRCGWSRFTGKPESGKTAQGLAWGAQWQKRFPKDGFVVPFNAEGRITADLIKRSGIDTDPKRFLMLDSNVGDYIVDKVIKWIHNNPHGKRYFFLTDSADAMIRLFDIDKPAKELEKVGGSAALQSFFGKRVSLPLGKLGHHLYMSSQIRANISQGEGGANAPKFYSSLTGTMGIHYEDKAYQYIHEVPGDKNSKRIGHLAAVKLSKTPNESTGRIVIIPIKYKHVGGVWQAYEILIIGQAWGWLERKGSWFSSSEAFTDELVKEKIIDDEISAQGERALLTILENNPKLVDYISEKFKTLH